MYRNRESAGEILAKKIAACNYNNVSILAIPRGGILVAAPIAKLMNVSLGVLVTRKISHPANSEVAIGAVMPDGSTILDSSIIERFSISANYIDIAAAEQYRELRRRLLLYEPVTGTPMISGKTIVLVDDGIATGYTIKAAIKWIKGKGAANIVVAVPVASPEIVEELSQKAMVICLLQPYDFRAVGFYYSQFPQTSDEEVLAVLKNIKNY